MHFYCCGFNGLNQLSESNKVYLNPIEISNGIIEICNSTFHGDSNVIIPDKISIYFTWNKIYIHINNKFLNFYDIKDNKIKPCYALSFYIISVSTISNKLYAIDAENNTIISLNSNDEIEHHLLNSKNKIKKIYSIENNLVVLQDIDNHIQIFNVQNNAPINVKFPYKVKNIACGKHHILILTIIGTVFSFGNGGQGQLGHGSIDSCDDFKIVEALNGVCMYDIAAGGWHSLALSDGGDVYTWGWNNFGQLGLPSRHIRGNSPDCINIQTYPCLVTFPFNPDETSIIGIVAGSRHSLALTDQGQVYAWGWNKYGQLGIGLINAKQFIFNFDSGYPTDLSDHHLFTEQSSAENVNKSVHRESIRKIGSTEPKYHTPKDSLEIDILKPGNTIIKDASEREFVCNKHEYLQDLDMPTLIKSFEKVRINKIFAGMWNSGFLIN